VRRLLPDPVDHVTPEQAYAFARDRHPSGRPWVGVCMVASVDGSTVTDGRSGGLSCPTDHDVLLALRSVADLILVGAATVRAEGYGVPRKPGQRIGVVSRTGRIDPTTDLFTSGAGFLVLPEDTGEAPEGVDVVRAGQGDVDLGKVLRGLDAAFVQAEGGSMLNGALAAAGLIDELKLTVAPRLAGGDGPRVTQGAPELRQGLSLAHVLEEDGFLFTRWVRSDLDLGADLEHPVGG
jgi:riboflavin biosynthesis pyrimidine reductase